MYIETYRNTFAVDVLEYFDLVKFDNYAPTIENCDLESDLKECDSASKLKLEKQDDPFLVEFSGPIDPEHPHNWSSVKRFVTVCNVMLLTCVTYMGDFFLHSWAGPD